MNKHILFVLDYYLPHRGGSETVFEAIISRLLTKGYTISVLTSRFDPTLPQEEKKEHLNIWRVGRGRLSFMIWGLIKGILLLMKYKDISLIHTSTYGGAIPASILGKLFRKKVILTVHEIFGKLWNQYKGYRIGWLYRIFESIIFCFPYTTYHCVSRYTMNALRIVYGIPDKKIKMIYNGVDTKFWDPKEVSPLEIKNWKIKHGWTDRYVVLYYGHAGKSKGVDFLVHALPELIAVDQKLLFVFNLIESKRTSYIKKIIRNYCTGASVQIFDGMKKEQLRTMIASADMIIAPSLSEGFGSVHTESVAMKKPLLTTYIASIPEVVRGNVKLISPASKREIIQAILHREEWIENPDYVIPLKNFSRNETIKELIKLYR